MGSKQLPEIDRKQWKFQKKCARGATGWPVEPANFFKRTSVKCPVVAQTQGYHLVCIWGSLVKFQGGGVVLKTMLCARVDLLSFCTGLTLVFQSSMSPSN